MWRVLTDSFADGTVAVGPQTTEGWESIGWETFSWTFREVPVPTHSRFYDVGGTGTLVRTKNSSKRSWLRLVERSGTGAAVARRTADHNRASSSRSRRPSRRCWRRAASANARSNRLDGPGQLRHRTDSAIGHPRHMGGPVRCIPSRTGLRHAATLAVGRPPANLQAARKSRPSALRSAPTTSSRESNGTAAYAPLLVGGQSGLLVGLVARRFVSASFRRRTAWRRPAASRTRSGVHRDRRWMPARHPVSACPCRSA